MIFSRSVLGVNSSKLVFIRLSCLVPNLGTSPCCCNGHTAPSGITHDFENRGAVRAGVLNISAPGNFEQHMPQIISWFEQHPPGKAGGS